MDFSLTEEETAVVEAAAQVAADADPWSALRSGGWLDLLVDDPAAGIGYLGLMAEGLGAGGVSVPLIGSAVVWPTLFGEPAGGMRVAVADRLIGPGDLAEDGIGAERLAVLEAGAGWSCEEFSVAPAGRLEGDGLSQVVPGPEVRRVDDGDRVAEARRRAAAVAAAEMAGTLRRVAEMTRNHVAERQQFGRPIAAFQVVSHGAARLATLAEGALWAARGACRSDDLEQTHAAKGWISRASAEASALAHQLHGAIGFTEEYGLQHLTKRLRTLRFAWGDDRTHYLALGRLRAGG